MKHSAIMIVMVMMVWCFGPGEQPANADSFGFYFRDNGFGIGMEFRDYDYYDRYSPGYYDNTEINFYTYLEPYGQWEYVDDFNGYIWMPFVSMSWRPYTYGSWSYTDYGWTWVAYEPWGWIPHHYGRWFFHPLYRWIWIPGYDWAPAYVTWGYSDGYYAWAPLPPDNCNYYMRYRPSHHREHRDRYRDYDDRYYRHGHRDRSTHWYRRQSAYQELPNAEWIPNEAWVTVSHDNLLASNIASVELDQEQNMRVISSERFSTVKNQPDLHRVERSIGRSIPKTVVDETFKKVNGKKVKVVSPVNVLEKRHDVVEPIRKMVDTERDRSIKKKVVDPSKRSGHDWESENDSKSPNFVPVRPRDTDNEIRTRPGKDTPPNTPKEIRGNDEPYRTAPVRPRDTDNEIRTRPGKDTPPNAPKEIRGNDEPYRTAPVRPRDTDNEIRTRPGKDTPPNAPKEIRGNDEPYRTAPVRPRDTDNEIRTRPGKDTPPNAPKEIRGNDDPNRVVPIQPRDSKRKNRVQPDQNRRKPGASERKDDAQTQSPVKNKEIRTPEKSKENVPEQTKNFRKGAVKTENDNQSGTGDAPRKGKAAKSSETKEKEKKGSKVNETTETDEDDSEQKGTVKGR